MKIGGCFIWVAVAIIEVAGAQQKDVKKAEPKPEEMVWPKTWEVTCELFSLPGSDASQLRRTQMDSRDIYHELVKRVEGKTANLEEFVVMKTLVSKEAESVSVEELIFPMEYDPPELPNYIEDQLPDLRPLGISTPAHPTEFDQRDLGLSVNLIGSELLGPDMISLDLALERVISDGNETWGQNLAAAKVPRFQVQDLKEQVTLRNGQHVLLGSMSPPWNGAKEIRRVWLAFVSARIVFEQEKRPKNGESEREIEFQEVHPWNATCEVFSLSLSEAAKLKREKKTDPEIYAHLLKSPGASLEEFVTLDEVGFEVGTFKSVREMSFGTSFDPAGVPNGVHDLSEDPAVIKRMITPANPTGFETREVGSIIQLWFMPVSGEKLTLNYELELSDFLGRDTWGRGPAEVQMPRFSSQRLASETGIRIGRPSLLGSISPPAVLQPKDGERRVWWAFLTISESRK